MTGAAHAPRATLMPYGPPPQIPNLRALACEEAGSPALVRRLVSAWHSTHPPRIAWKRAFLLRNGSAIVGVSVWGLPTARLEDNTGSTWEHYRMALSPEAPKNSASWFIAHNRDWIRDRAPDVRRLIAYVDLTVHSGVTYRADNWRRVACDFRGRPWTPNAAHPGRKSKPLGRRAKFERAP